VAEARRRGIARAQAMGFDETAAGRVAIVVTELATNIVKYDHHARSGARGRLDVELVREALRSPQAQPEAAA
jgi:anti-sigma regulatory factor (Ser/Thr protein kinase)